MAALADRIGAACVRLRSLTGVDIDQGTTGGEIAAVLQELEGVPMTVELLRQTRAGSVVNSAQARLQNRILKGRAKKLITIWKAVAAGDNGSRDLGSNTTLKHAVISTKPSIDELQAAKRVPMLQALCLNVLRCNVSRIGRLNATFPSSLLLGMLQNAKANDLRRIEALNPEIMPELNELWKKLSRLDLPDQYNSIEAAENMPASFWREFYQTVLDERERKATEYAKCLAERSHKAQDAKEKSSMKKLSAQASIVKNTIKRSRDEPSAHTGGDRRAPNASRATPPVIPKGKSRLAKLLQPAKKRMKMERGFKR